MTDKLFVLLLLRTVSLTQVPQRIPLRIVKIHENITLRCSQNDANDLLFWYKQRLGHGFQLISKTNYDKTELQAQFKNSRFIVTTSDEDSNLTITNINKDDEATYFCGVGSRFDMKYDNGSYLVVNESDHERSINQALLPVSGSVPLGGRVTLQCWVVSGSRGYDAQCTGGHNVFWFRNESHPGMVSSHWNRSRGCETEPGSAPQRCVYSLYKDSVLSSDAGMYYCAVAACGEILFGKGVKLEINQKLDPLVIVLGLLLACCVIVIVILIYYIRNMKSFFEGTLNTSSHHGRVGSAVHQEPIGDEEVNYAALDFSARKPKGKKKMKRRELNSESTYSAVRVRE